MKLNKTIIILTAMISLPSFAFSEPSGLKTPHVLNVISYTAFKPISYNNDQGYEPDLLRAVAKLWHVKIAFHPESIYEGIWHLPSRQYTVADVATGGFHPMATRIEEGSAFSTPTVKYQQSLLVRKEDYENDLITSYNSFKNTQLKIGVVPGTTGELYARPRAKQAGLQPDQIVTYPTEQQLLDALKAKKIAAIGRGTIGNDYQASQGNEFITIARKDYHEVFAFPVNKNNPDLVKKLNEAILYLTNNGKISYADWSKNHQVFMERVVNS